MKIFTTMTQELANSWWMYLLGAIVVVFVIVGSILFIVRAYKDADNINMDKKVLKNTVKNSIIFSILPSISILFGVVALAPAIGIPLPWIRLSVIGALHYEGAAVSATGYPTIASGEMTTVQFATTAIVMTIGILLGPIFCLFGFKAYDKKLLSKLKTDVENNEGVQFENEPVKPKKKSFGPVLFSAAFIAMICSFLAEDFAKLKFIGNETSEAAVKALGSISNAYTPTVVIFVAFGVMALCDLLEKKCKWKWLGDFSLGLAMIVGMVVACILG